MGHSAPTASRAAPRSKRVSNSPSSRLRNRRSSPAGEACRARALGGGHAVVALVRGVRGNAPGAAAQRRDLTGVPRQRQALQAQAPIAWPVGQLLRSTGENPKPKPRGHASISKLQYSTFSRVFYFLFELGKLNFVFDFRIFRVDVYEFIWDDLFRGRVRIFTRVRWNP